jgi:hypothetical protein
MMRSVTEMRGMYESALLTAISNLFLRFNAYGKHLLNPKEIISSNFVGASFLIFVAGVICYIIARDDKFLTIAAFGFAMMLPYSAMLSPSKSGYALIIYAGVMTLIGLGAIINAFITGETFNFLTTLFIIGFVVFQFLANYLLIKENNK